MHPAPPASLQLAKRLRELRERWPRLTQKGLAAAFSTEEKLASATVSSWESLTSPKPPPRHRILAYARFFCTPRSIEGTPTLFPFDQLTEDERKTYEELETELLRLRDAVSKESGEEEPTFHRSWHFPDAGRVTFICAQLPGDQIGPFGNPSNANFTELQTYADIDALVELFGHIRAENPTALVQFRTPPEVVRDDLMGHLILLGGVVWNDITERLSEMANLPVRQDTTQSRLKSGDIFVAQIEGEERQFWPKWSGEDADQKVLTEDVGLLARVPNPLNSSRTLTICNGIHSRGVYGAVRTLTDAELRDSNERYIAAKFSDAESFVILMSVKVIRNKAMTPDFNGRDVVLYEWTPDTQ